jgi:hypothetical protein
LACAVHAGEMPSSLVEQFAIVAVPR